MMTRLALSFLLAMTVGLAPVPMVSARTCILTGSSNQKACSAGCCANKSCCIDSQKTRALPNQPLAKSNTTSQEDISLSTTTALVVANPHLQVREFVSAECACSYHSPPRLALLCTFLI
jgi:hypothetical protein